MKQHDAINIILGELVNKNYINASYLTGTIVTSPNVDGIIDFHVIIKKDFLPEFKKNFLSLFEAYYEILFIREEDNKIICVYENDVFINFNYYLDNQVIIDTDYIGIYDPDNLLKHKVVKHNITSDIIGNMINDFSIKLNTFYYSFLQNNSLIAFKLGLSIFDCYTSIIHNTSKESTSIESLIERGKYLEVLKLLNYNKYLIAVYTMTIDINGLIGNLPISVAQKINYDYFLRVKKLIFSLIEE